MKTICKNRLLWQNNKRPLYKIHLSAPEKRKKKDAHIKVSALLNSTKGCVSVSHLTVQPLCQRWRGLVEKLSPCLFSQLLPNSVWERFGGLVL